MLGQAQVLSGSPMSELGSKADLKPGIIDVCFAPESGPGRTHAQAIIINGPSGQTEQNC
jgi:hypothetical protein